MKICFTIAEYNPFHLGHAKHLAYMKKDLGAEYVVVLMSGNFTQRGEPAILNKFKRAEHAIKAGADAVIELPSVFATGNAETFAKGAINIISSLGVEGGLCFGVEGGEKQEFLDLAYSLNNESKEYKKALKEHLENGVSLAKAKFLALKETGKEFNENLISSPNNVLGVEYTKAILSYGANLEIFPMKREGDHNDTTLKKGITSATSIRKMLKSGKVKKLKGNLPLFVYKDLKEYPNDFDKILMASALTTSAEDMAKLPDCTEGLENRIKALAKDNVTVDELIEKVTTKRYTSTRIRRILTANLLGITKGLVNDSITSPLYAKILAVNGENKEIISILSQNANIPVLTRKSNLIDLKKTAKKCFEIDVLANDLYSLVTEKRTNENQMIII